MLLFVTLLASMLKLVPLTVLAGLLVFVGVKLVNTHHIQELRRRGELSVYVVTVAGVVGINLLAGIALGLALAVGRLLWQLGKVHVHVKQHGDVHQVRVGGALTFVGVPKLSAALSQVPMGAKVELDLAVETLDHSGYEALESWSERTARRAAMCAWSRSKTSGGARAAAPLLPCPLLSLPLPRLSLPRVHDEEAHSRSPGFPASQPPRLPLHVRAPGQEPVSGLPVHHLRGQPRGAQPPGVHGSGRSVRHAERGQHGAARGCRRASPWATAPRPRRWSSPCSTCR